MTQQCPGRMEPSSEVGPLSLPLRFIKCPRPFSTCCKSTLGLTLGTSPLRTEPSPVVWRISSVFGHMTLLRAAPHREGGLIRPATPHWGRLQSSKACWSHLAGLSCPLRLWWEGHIGWPGQSIFSGGAGSVFITED